MEDFGEEIDETQFSFDSAAANQKTEVTEDTQKDDTGISQMTFQELYEICAAQDAEKKSLTESNKKMNQARMRRQEIIRRKQPQSKVWDSLDTTINMSDLLDARGEEVNMCEGVVMSNHDKMAVTQRVPIYMRRRAMNHHMRRIPVFARLQALKSLTANAAKSKKMKYKKHRIKKLCKSMDFRRRQKNFRWLETHLWHAKRFKMIEKWGYKIPFFCHDKILRALHRDITTKTAVCDISYYCWIELNGMQKDLLKMLSLLTNHTTGLGFAANDVIGGSKEGNVVLYEPEKYPRGCIGPVSFIWKPPEPKEFVGKTRDEKYSCTTRRRLWICFHPSMKFPLLKVLDLLLQKSDVVFKNLEKCLNCFEFYGPDTLKILQEIIYISNADMQFSDKFVSSQNNEYLRRIKKTFWWSWCYDTKEMRDELNQQKTAWENAKKDGITPGQVIGIVARDPRVAFRRRQPEKPRNEAVRNCVQTLTPNSFIWDDDVRDYVTRRKLSNNQVNKHLSNRLPFSLVDVFDEEARIPMLLIRKSNLSSECNEMLKASSSNSYSESIWKLIVPKNWAMPFWILFKKMKLRVFGLRERERFATRGKCLVYPRDFLDSVVGRFSCIQNSAELNRTLNRKPLSKRFNFARFGIQNPFLCEYEKLLGTNCESESESFITVRKEMRTCLFDEKVLNPVLNFTVPTQENKRKRKPSESVDTKNKQNGCNPSKKLKFDGDDVAAMNQV